MQRWRNLLLVTGIVALVVFPSAALAQEEPQVDLMQFIPEQFRADFADRNGDGIPDLSSIPPEGVAGIWDDKVGEVTDEGFLGAVTGTAIDAGVKALGLFHHNQDRTDKDIDGMVKHCRELISKKGSKMKCFAVAKGTEIRL